MATSIDPILFVLQRAPYGSTAARDVIDGVLACASFDQPVQLLFTGDGVWQLLPEQQGHAIDMKDIGKLLAALPYYDVNALYADATALAERGLDAATLVMPVQVLDEVAMRTLLRDARQVITL